MARMGEKCMQGFGGGDNGDILEELESNEDKVKCEGKGKGRPRTGREGPEGIVMKFYITVFVNLKLKLKFKI